MERKRSLQESNIKPKVKPDRHSEVPSNPITTVLYQADRPIVRHIPTLSFWITSAPKGRPTAPPFGEDKLIIEMTYTYGIAEKMTFHFAYKENQHRHNNMT